MRNGKKKSKQKKKKSNRVSHDLPARRENTISTEHDNSRVDNPQGLFKRIIKKIYFVISIISTLSVFSWLLFALIGLFVKRDYSDNDILFKQINKYLNEDEMIVSIDRADIHGFGDDSIIVVTDNDWINESDNRVLILEKLTNDFFSKLINPFGIGSEYVLKYEEKNQDDWGYYTKLDFVGNISSSYTKDIVLSYNGKGSTYGYKYYKIIGYSDENREYYYVGSYPDVYKVDGLSYYDENGFVTGGYPRNLDDINVEEKDIIDYSYYCVPIWVENVFSDRKLLVVSCDKRGTECLVNLYIPIVESGVLHWRISLSEVYKDFDFWNIFYSDKLVDILNYILQDNYVIVE